MHTFGDDIKNGEMTIDKATNEQNKLKQKIKELKRNAKPKNPKMIKEKSDVKNNAIALLKGKEMLCNGFESGMFLLPNQSIALAEYIRALKWLLWI